MPAQLREDGLTIVCTFSDGRRRRYNIAGVAPGPLARDLLAALAGMIHPHGTVDAPATANRVHVRAAGSVRVRQHARGSRGRVRAEPGSAGGVLDAGRVAS